MGGGGGTRHPLDPVPLGGGAEVMVMVLGEQPTDDSSCRQGNASVGGISFLRMCGKFVGF